MSDRVYNFIKTLVIVILAAGISWIAATRYTMETAEVWYEPRIDQVAVMDYFGNLYFHYFDEE